VGYRRAACDTAVRLSVCGWVRNLPDGRVEVLASGSAEALSSFAAWLHQGPSLARVSAVVSFDCAEPALAGFDIR